MMSLRLAVMMMTSHVCLLCSNQQVPSVSCQADGRLLKWEKIDEKMRKTKRHNGFCCVNFLKFTLTFIIRVSKSRTPIYFTPN